MSLKTFVTPKDTKIIEDSEGTEIKIINERAYKNRIVDYNRIRWLLIIHHKVSKTEVDNMTLDELLEAYYAAEIFAQEEKAEIEAAKNSS